MSCMIGRWLCRLFGHAWFYQPRSISDNAPGWYISDGFWRKGQPPARTCTRCVPFRRVERLIDGVWREEP